MKEHGLIRTGEMVRAFLDGRKTQTRIRIKRGHFCKYAVGDVVYIRETCKRFTGCARDGRPWEGTPFILSPDGNPYKALIHIVGNESHVDCLDSAAACVTVPSIHMPKWAARLWYPITAIKAPERARDISGADAEAEGWFVAGELFPNINRASKAQAWFLRTWHSLYGRIDEWTWPLVLGERIQR